MRLLALSVLIVIAFVAMMAVHPVPSNAVTYCKAAGVPPGCVMRSNAPVAKPKLCPVVQLAPDGSMISVIACDLPDIPLYGPADTGSTYGRSQKRQRTAAARKK